MMQKVFTNILFRFFVFACGTAFSGEVPTPITQIFKHAQTTFNDSTESEKKFVVFDAAIFVKKDGDACKGKEPPDGDT